MFVETPTNPQKAPSERDVCSNYISKKALSSVDSGMFVGNTASEILELPRSVIFVASTLVKKH